MRLTYSLLKPGSSRVVQLFAKYWFTTKLGLSLPRKNVVRLTDRLDMTIDVDWDVDPQHNNNNHF